MKVSTNKPFKIVYSIYQHQFLGYLVESFAVQADENGKLTLQHQNISYKNCNEFASEIDKDDLTLIKTIDQIQQDYIVKTFSPKKLTAAEFFFKIYDPVKGDKAIQEQIEATLERRKATIFALLKKDKLVFEMSNDGEPTWKRLYFQPSPASVLFHFQRTELNTLYSPTVKHEGKTLDLISGQGIIVANEPAVLLLGDRLYTFDKPIDGNKIKPFLKKKHILIQRSMEEQYYKKFIAPLIASYDVYAQGFSIVSDKPSPQAILTMTELSPGKAKTAMLSLFDGEEEEEEASGPEAAEDGDALIHFDLKFHYGQYDFGVDVKASGVDVYLEKKGDSYIFHRVARRNEWERNLVLKLVQSGLPIKNGRASMDRSQAFTWLARFYEEQAELQLEIRQQTENGKRYFIGRSSINVEIRENRDWFDIQAVVRFGEYEIPFLRLRKYILQKKTEFELPNGEIAVIPSEWFTQYADLLAFTKESPSEADQLQLPIMHLALVEELGSSNLAAVSLNNRLQRLRDFKAVEDFPVPPKFRGELRPYQKAGYDWMRFLNQYKLGGCLADDMGLGKTVQTLALLLSQKEEGVKKPSLLVMPTSLVYNWEVEARKFTPDLKVFVYAGTGRDKRISTYFGYYDLILTSYGTVRADIESLAAFDFHYIILDESQAIKNPSSIIARSVQDLRAQHKLILTGTPLENSTMDLWSQINFINPGLLGTQTFFRNEFLGPIEKKNDAAKLARLHAIIKPFILRRNKTQVATELPPKVENVQYCSMSPEQEKAYEEAKSYYRNQILDQIEKEGIAKSQIFLLQGLTKLRQMANNPRMVDEGFEGKSGKDEDVIYKLEELINEDHKVLVFSQFVKHLQIVKEFLDERGVPYAYLDGSTKDRKAQVDRFQQEADVRVFLISLKAGGVGLNLTAADYVFILDPWWNPAVEAQAVDRAHRIGQDKTVFIYKFITRSSVEEKILLLQRNKKELSDILITTEESFVKSLTTEDIMELLG